MIHPTHSERSTEAFVLRVRTELLQLVRRGGDLLQRLPEADLISGKLHRARLVHRAAQNAQIETSTALSLATSIELIQLASLIQDDWMDHSAQRRQQPALWKKIGSAPAILIATQLIAEAYQQLTAHVPAAALPAVITTFSSAIRHACLGQYRDVSSPADLVSLSDYERLAMEKTGYLLTLPLDLVQAASPAQKATTMTHSLARELGCLYQGLNDIENLQQWPQRIPDDVKRGRPTLPLIIAATLGLPLPAEAMTRRDAFTVWLTHFQESEAPAQLYHFIEAHLQSARRSQLSALTPLLDKLEAHWHHLRQQWPHLVTRTHDVA
jgi:geranylgeranyl pyrophosphate synthase